jgi:glucose-1-phosphate cytidylyltransferase
MKVVILAGGLGTRLVEETEVKPKPMVDIGGRPILWHIMKHYAHFGFKEFFIALGYKGEDIKRFFMDYSSFNGDMSINLASGALERHPGDADDWLVHLMDTGLLSSTGGRVRRCQPYLKDETFMATYGDGVSDVDLQDLLRFHRSQGRIATVTAVRPPARFGGLIFDGDLVKEFTEKPQIGEGWVNGGFLIFEPEVFAYIKGKHRGRFGREEVLARSTDIRDWRYWTGRWLAGASPLGRGRGCDLSGSRLDSSE